MINYIHLHPSLSTRVSNIRHHLLKLNKIFARRSWRRTAGQGGGGVEGQAGRGAVHPGGGGRQPGQPGSGGGGAIGLRKRMESWPGWRREFWGG